MKIITTSALFCLTCLSCLDMQQLSALSTHSALQHDQKKENKKEDFISTIESTAKKAKHAFEESYQTLTDELQSSKQHAEIEIKKISEKIHNDSQKEDQQKLEHSTLVLSFSTTEKNIKLQVQTYQQSSTFIIHVTNKNKKNNDAEHNSLAELRELQTYIKKHFNKDFNAQIAKIILDQCIQGIGSKQKHTDVSIESFSKNYQQKYIIEITTHTNKKHKNQSLLTELFDF